MVGVRVRVRGVMKEIKGRGLTIGCVLFCLGSGLDVVDKEVEVEWVDVVGVDVVGRCDVVGGSMVVGLWWL